MPVRIGTAPAANPLPKADSLEASTAPLSRAAVLFSAATPTNAVMAAATFWLCRCHRTASSQANRRAHRGIPNPRSSLYGYQPRFRAVARDLSGSAAAVSRGRCMTRRPKERARSIAYGLTSRATGAMQLLHSFYPFYACSNPSFPGANPSLPSPSWPILARPRRLTIWQTCSVPGDAYRI